MDGLTTYCLSFLRTLLGQLLVAHIGNHMSHELLSTMTGTIRDRRTTSTNFILANKAKLKKVAQGPPPLFTYRGGP